MKNKILYFIHVPWKWIKQRPHFIAEELTKENEVVVAEIRPFASKFRSMGEQSVNLRSYFQFPKDRIPAIHLCNKILLRLQLGKYLRNSNLYWFTNPYQYSFFKRNDIKGKIVYDCMDDLPEFEPTEERRKKLEKAERRLYWDASVVVASSEYLKQKLYKRYGERDVQVVNNAIKSMDSDSCRPLSEEIKNKMPEGRYVISYIGTIEKWIDIELIEEVLKQVPEVEFCFFGPLRIELPINNRIHYCGMVPHDMVFAVMEHSDALIMPFVLNELILSVNPVKLYEYIYSSKPCLAPRYGESEAFGDYVYLYESKEECCRTINELINGKGAKHSKDENITFALSNTWKERVEQIEKIIQ